MKPNPQVIKHVCPMEVQDFSSRNDSRFLYFRMSTFKNFCIICIKPQKLWAAGEVILLWIWKWRQISCILNYPKPPTSPPIQFNRFNMN